MYVFVSNFLSSYLRGLQFEAIGLIGRRCLFQVQLLGFLSMKVDRTKITNENKTKSTAATATATTPYNYDQINYRFWSATSECIREENIKASKSIVQTILVYSIIMKMLPLSCHWPQWTNIRNEERNLGWDFIHCSVYVHIVFEYDWKVRTAHAQHTTHT